MQKTNQKKFEIEEVIKKKGDKLQGSGKVMIVRFIAG